MSRTLYGTNSHHIIESCFKGLARALRRAIEIDPRKAEEVPSTKGKLRFRARRGFATMKLAVVDYGSGNLRSAAKALERAAADAELSAEVAVTPDPEGGRGGADRIVLPGVGAFGDCRRGLAALDGMIEALEEAVLEAGRPFLGICVGMQLMATTGLEHGRHPGLGLDPGSRSSRSIAEGLGLKIPHMGWNELNFDRRATTRSFKTWTTTPMSTSCTALPFRPRIGPRSGQKWSITAVR